MKWMILLLAIFCGMAAPYFGKIAMTLHKEDLEPSREIAYWVYTFISFEAFLFFAIWFFVWYFSRS